MLYRLFLLIKFRTISLRDNYRISLKLSIVCLFGLDMIRLKYFSISDISIGWLLQKTLSVHILNLDGINIVAWMDELDVKSLKATAAAGIKSKCLFLKNEIHWVLFQNLHVSNQQKKTKRDCMKWWKTEKVITNALLWLITIPTKLTTSAWKNPGSWSKYTKVNH